MSAADKTPLELLIAAGRLKSRDEFLFHLVNRSVAMARYDRASAWTLRRSPRLEAVSGPGRADPSGSFASAWSRCLAGLRRRNESVLLGDDAFAKPAVWRALREKTPGLSAVWVPLPRCGAGILFERWDGPFSPDDAVGFRHLGEAYELMWRGGRRRPARGWGRAFFWLLFLAALTAAMLTVRVPLRIVAPCEVAARDPRLVAAPMEGVVESVAVVPGQMVSAGDRLAVYDSRLMEEELNVSRRQVEVAETELSSARAKGFLDQGSRGEVARLEARLEQEIARLRVVETNYSRRFVDAPVDGMVQLDDARAWRGKPVSTGQAILWLVNPSDTRLKLWLPQDDRIDFDRNGVVNVHLHALGGEARPARLTYVSSFAQATGDGGHAFFAEAEWLDAADAPPLGLRGSAFLYGRETTLGYWLLRRPMAKVRIWLGI